MESFLGSGDVYMDRLTAAGVRTGLFFAGNCTKLGIQPSAELKKQKSKGRDTYGQVMATAALPGESTLSIIFDQVDKRNMAINLMGSVTDIDKSADSVTDEALTVLTLDLYQRLANRNIDPGSIAVKNVIGNNAAAWQAEHAYLTTDYCIPVSGNGHYYKCTTAGTSAASEPTWPTNGSTVSDGTAVWTDQGLIEYVEGTDYELVDRTGMFRAITGGSIIAGQALEIDYDYLATTGWKVTGGTESVIKAYVFLDGKNETNGKDMEVEVWEVQFTPKSLIDFLSADFATVELEGTPVTPTGYTSPYEVKQYD